MRRRFAAVNRVAGWVLALLLAGCLPDSVNPLSPPDQGVAAPELLGLWAMPAEDVTLYVHVLRGPENRLVIATVSHEDDGSGAVERYEAHVTAIGSVRFASFRLAAEPDGAAEADATAPAVTPYAIVGYVADAETLTVSFLDPDTLARAIAEGRLAGEVETDSWGTTVRLTGSGAEIRAFLASADPATLFGRRLALVRLPPPPRR